MSIIDSVILRKIYRNMTKGVRLRMGPERQSNHYMLEAKLCVKGMKEIETFKKAEGKNVKQNTAVVVTIRNDKLKEQNVANK